MLNRHNYYFFHIKNFQGCNFFQCHSCPPNPYIGLLISFVVFLEDVLPFVFIWATRKASYYAKPTTVKCPGSILHFPNKFSNPLAPSLKCIVADATPICKVCLLTNVSFGTFFQMHWLKESLTF